MASQSTNLFSLARSKLHLSLGSKDNCSLHRWVLLKNSIIQSPPLTTTTAPACSTVASTAYPPDEEEVGVEEEADSFMFPDAGKLADVRAVPASEAEWLDSLLETLGDDDEDDEEYADGHSSSLQLDDDEDQPLSPLMSPMSSSDDLVNHPLYYPPPVSVAYYPYPVPYPPFHPPLVRSHALRSPLDPSPPRYDDPLPYYDIDDVEDLSVPDAIEDDSDDESDAPTTPSLVTSNSSSLTDPASIPLPDVANRRSGRHPHVYIDTDESYFFNRLELNPHNSYNPIYQEC
jgi:hypothetical protein